MPNARFTTIWLSCIPVQYSRTAFAFKPISAFWSVMTCLRIYLFLVEIIASLFLHIISLLLNLPCLKLQLLVALSACCKIFLNKNISVAYDLCHLTVFTIFAMTGGRRLQGQDTSSTWYKTMASNIDYTKFDNFS